MSSLVRRLEIRGLKRRGYQRSNFVLEPRPDGGQPQLRRVARGGLILSPTGEIVGTRWPRPRQLAAGGIVTGGGTYIVGERTSESMAPLHFASGKAWDAVRDVAGAFAGKLFVRPAVG